jgi:hypothetical protein
MYEFTGMISPRLNSALVTPLPSSLKVSDKLLGSQFVGFRGSKRGSSVSQRVFEIALASQWVIRSLLLMKSIVLLLRAQTAKFHNARLSTTQWQLTDPLSPISRRTSPADFPMTFDIEMKTEYIYKTIN